MQHYHRLIIGEVKQDQSCYHSEQMCDNLSGDLLSELLCFEASEHVWKLLDSNNGNWSYSIMTSQSTQIINMVL